MQHLIAIALGGALGALCRHAANMLCIRWFAASMVYATFTVNVVGCLLIGVLAASPLGQNMLARAALGVGFLGALTTFSTLGIETVRLFQLNSPIAALMNVVAHVILGIAATVIGLQLGRSLFGVITPI